MNTNSSYQSAYLNAYKPLLRQLIKEIKEIKKSNLPEPFFPVCGKYFEQSKIKIAFVGWETRDNYHLEKFYDVAMRNSENALCRWQNDFDTLWFIEETNNFGTTFWNFILKFLASLYNEDISNFFKIYYDEDSSDSSDYGRIFEILQSFIWANTDSIERYEAAEREGADRESYRKLKEASKVFDCASNWVNVYNPNVVIVLNWYANEDWFIQGFNNYDSPKPISDHLWYGYVRDTDTHFFWTKHPQGMAHVNFGLDKIIINDILVLLKRKKISFPGEKNLISNNLHNELLDKFQNEIKEIAQELYLKCDFNTEGFGKNETGFYFYRPEWQFCKIGFEFESYRKWLSGFFYGVGKRNGIEKIPSHIYQPIINKLGISDGEVYPEYWPWWKWHEHKNWDIKTFAEIGNDNLMKEIGRQVKDLLQKLEGLKL